MLTQIKQELKLELDELNLNMANHLLSSASSYNEVLAIIEQNKGKQIRPIVGILVAKLLNCYDKNIEKFLQAVELIHNATLFHDDVIDDTDYRRNTKTLHKQFSNKLAILSGDYFLAIAIKIIASLNNHTLNSLSANFIAKICEGEIEQNLSLYKIPTLDEYLEKTKNKTALLFKLTTLGVAILADLEKYGKDLGDFGENLGMVFQLSDDLKNFNITDDKPTLNDLKSGVITAPIIFLSKQNPKISQMITHEAYDDILDLLQNSNAIAQTYQLIYTYQTKAKETLLKLPNNNYSDLLLNLLSKFGNN